MDKDLRDFMNGDKNAVKVEIIISREKTDNGTEHVYIKEPDSLCELYDFWHNPEKARGDKPPKHTGGKKPYIMLMVEAIRKLKGDNVETAISSAIMLADNIQWNTGLLTDKRKKKPLSYEDLRKLYGCSNDKLTNKIKAMEHHGILLKDKEGYKISTDFIKKGGAKV